MWQKRSEADSEVDPDAGPDADPDDADVSLREKV
jgi:hypothetical protein